MNKAIPDNMVDTAAMLFSTDWFLPFWALIDIEIRPQRCLQEGCRKIVSELMDGAENYYLINFSPERTDFTRRSMRELAAQCGLTGAAKESFEKLIVYKAEREQFYKTAWLFCSLIEQLSRDPTNDDAVRFILKRSAQEFSFANGFDFNTACMESKTPWDDLYSGPHTGAAGQPGECHVSKFAGRSGIDADPATANAGPK